MNRRTASSTLSCGSTNAAEDWSAKPSEVTVGMLGMATLEIAFFKLMKFAKGIQPIHRVRHHLMPRVAPSPTELPSTTPRKSLRTTLGITHDALHSVNGCPISHDAQK